MSLPASMPASAGPNRPALSTMRFIATGLLVAMSLVFVSVTLTGAGGAWGYVRAFAEAAMVGGLADWFAVTALFRHPLGLPIPHTAIIPKSKTPLAIAIIRNMVSPRCAEGCESQAADRRSQRAAPKA